MASLDSDYRHHLQNPETIDFPGRPSLEGIKDIFSKPCTESSIMEIDQLLSDFIQKICEENPRMGAYGMLCLIKSQLPQFIPKGIQGKALQSAYSADANTSGIGKRVIFCLNANSIISAVDDNFIEGIDSEEEKEEMITSAFIFTGENLSKFQQVGTRLYRWGIEEYIAQREEVPVSWIKNGAYKLLTLGIKEIVSCGDLTNEALENLVESVFLDTSIPKDELINYIRDNYLLPEEENTTGNDPTFVDVYRKIAFRIALNTLPNLEKGVIKFRYGIGLSYMATGKELGVSATTVKEHEGKALRRLSHPITRRFLNECLSDDFPLPEDKNYEWKRYWRYDYKDYKSFRIK